ncbi:MAG: SDR family oxidoreductase [Oscillospiraceae bacterium]|nr:SDR family oxidoreductase [Oscillospiraceae bacterium]
MNLFDLKGKSAVVVGGAGGLGKVIAKGLRDAGAKILLADLTEEPLKAAAAELGADVEWFVGNAAVEGDVEALVAAAEKKLGKVTILVNAQGFNKKQDALDIDVDMFRQMLDANITGFMLTAKHFGRHFKANGYGKIINLSSVRGKIATQGPGNSGYCATKGAVDMLTKQLASEYGQFGVTVNAIGPNITMTPPMLAIFEMRAKAAGITVDEYLVQQGNAIPMRRMGQPEDLVGTAVFLAAPASDFMTGNILYPDGGLTAIG